MNGQGFDKILENWQRMIQQTVELFDEGQKKFLNASKNYFDSMQYFSEMSGNTPMKDMYKTISENIDSLKKKIDK